MYNTGNALGSADPRDLYDNAQALDEAINSPLPTFVDRRGNSRPTWAGAAFYVSLGNYAAGIIITGYNQLILHSGEYYKLSAGVALPYTTTGSWAGESANFVSVGDAALRSDLASSTDGFGDAFIAVKRPLTGAVATMLHDWINSQPIYLKGDFGAAGDGVTDDSAKFQAAVTAAYPSGTVVVENLRFLIDSNVTVPRGVRVVGMGQAGSVDFSTTWFGAAGSTLIVNSSATINLSESSCLENLFLMRKGLSIPESSAAAFAGTAISIGNNVDNFSDVRLSHLMILGFNKAVLGRRVPRLYAEDVKFDCVHGFDIQTAGDPFKLIGCHGWPFVTVAYTPYSGAQLVRNGSAYKFSVNGDGGKVIGCFAFDYLVSFDVDDCSGLIWDECGADAPEVATAIGWRIQGTSAHCQLSGCQSVANQYGLILDGDANSQLLVINGGYFAANTVNNIRIETGTILANNVDFGSTVDCTYINDAGAKLKLSGCITDSGVSGAVVNNFAGSPYVFIGHDNFWDDANVIYSGAPQIQSVTAASATKLPGFGSSILVAGNTTINSFTNGYPGRVVHLRFSGAPTVTHNATTLRLNGAANFVATASDVLSLMATDDDAWEQIAPASLN